MAEAISYALSGIWEGFSSAVYDGLVKPIVDFFSWLGTTIYNAIIDFFTWLGTSIYNAIVWVIDQVIGFFEYVLNSIRQYLPYAIMVTVAWIIITRTWKSENLSLLKKIGITIVTPIASFLISKVFDSIVPMGVQLPRLGVAIQPPKIESTFNHEQYISESVILEPKGITIEETFNHEQTWSEAIILLAPISVQETFDHPQTFYEEVALT